MRGNVRKYHARGYTQIGNVVLNDWSLSMKALACFARIQGLPDDWHFTASGLAETFSAGCSGKDGADSVRAALRELEERGYLIRGRVRDASGRFSSETIYATVDELGIYDAVLADLEADGIAVITRRPEGVEKNGKSAFSVTGSKRHDSTIDGDIAEKAQALEENRGEIEPDHVEKQNPRSEPIWSKPVLGVTCGNAKDVENLEPSVAEFSTIKAKPQVRTKTGLAYIGSANVGSDPATLEVNKILVHTVHPSVAGTGARGHARADGQAGSKGQPAPIVEPSGKDGCADGRTGPPDVPAQTDLDMAFDACRQISVNRNLLRNDRDRLATKEALAALMERGFTGPEIVLAWRKLHDELAVERREARYYPQLKSWLEQDAADACARARPKRGCKAEQAAHVQRSIRFEQMRQDDDRLAALVDEARRLDMACLYEGGDKDAAKRAWQRAWCYFDKRDHERSA